MNAYEKLCHEIAVILNDDTMGEVIVSSCWQVAYFRMKYSFETEWSYEYEPFIYQCGDYCDFCMDWWEGEQDIELLGVYSLDYLVKYYRKEVKQ